MTKDEFIKLLDNSGVSSNLVHFKNSVEDGYYIHKNYYRWEVFFRERGKDYDCTGFPSESNALEYLFEKVIGVTI